MLVAFQRRLIFAEVVIRDTQVAGHLRDHPAIVKLAKDLLGLAEKSQSFRFLTGMGICHRQIVQSVTLARTVA